MKVVGLFLKLMRIYNVDLFANFVKMANPSDGLDNELTFTEFDAYLVCLQVKKVF